MWGELLNDDKLDRNNWFAMNTQLYAGNQNHWIALTLCIPDKLYYIKLIILGESIQQVHPLPYCI
jgi:hypothetical protein